jgi:hypothetical protein
MGYKAELLDMISTNLFLYCWFPQSSLQEGKKSVISLTIIWNTENQNQEAWRAKIHKSSWSEACLSLDRELFEASKLASSRTHMRAYIFLPLPASHQTMVFFKPYLLLVLTIHYDNITLKISSLVQHLLKTLKLWAPISCILAYISLLAYTLPKFARISIQLCTILPSPCFHFLQFCYE